MPDSLTNFIANNYGDNYCVADVDGTSTSAVDELGLDDIDEIDTKNMAIYSRTPTKRERRSGGTSQQNMKKEPTDKEAIKVSEVPRKSQSVGQSLLIPSENAESQEMVNQIDADLMLNALNEQPTGSDLLGGNMENQMMDPLAAQNTIFDETSQVSFNYCSEDQSSF